MSENYLKKELYQKMKDEHTIFDFLQNGALDGIWYWDLEDPLNEWMSPRFWETLGYDPNDKKHSSTEWQTIIFEEDLMLAKLNIEKHLKDPSCPYDQIVRYKHSNGSTVWIRCRGLAIRDANGKAIRILGAHTNVTELKMTQFQIRDLKEEFEIIFHGTQDAMFLIDVLGPNQFKYVRTNKTHQEKTGIELHMIKDKTPVELLGHEFGMLVSANYQKCVDQRISIAYEEVLNLPAGRIVWHTTLSPVLTNGQVTHIVGSAADITKRKVLEEELEHRANHDSLTGLANREFLYQAIQKFIKNQANPFVFLFIDLDNFKVVNDQYGHKMGDELLKRVAERLLDFVSEHDVVARLGGDEFAVIKTNINGDFNASIYKEKILEHISKPVVCKQNTFEPSASIGVAHYPDDGSNYDELFIRSDQNMYQMKQGNK